jgi:hypothetical protein
VLRHAELLRLNFGVFTLHLTQVAMFMVVPAALVQLAGIPLGEHWKIYLPVVLASFVLMLPPIFVAEKYGRMKPVFLGAIGLSCCWCNWASGGALASAGAVDAGGAAVPVLRRLQHPGGGPAFAGVAHCAAGRQGRGAGRLQHLAGAGIVLWRRLRGWLKQNVGNSAVFLLGRPHADLAYNRG